MSTSAPRKFGFDTVFDDAGEVAYAAPRQKRLYPVEEVEAMLAQARAEGEQAAMQGMAALQAQALAQIAQACGAALPGLAAVAHEHREGSAELALACARAIADAALERFPEAPVRAALESLAREVSAAPRLVVSVAAPLVEPVQAVLAETAQSIGYAGHIQAKAGAGYVGAQFTLDFGDGSAAFDPAAAAQRVAQALEAALAAEGLHAEPLIPGQG